MLSNDITELISTQKSLNEAFQNLIDIEESEKEKFASELHDGLAQKLVAANLMINLLNEQFPQIDESKYSKMLKDTLQDSLNECSTLVKGVRPKTLMNLGFQKAIEEMIEDIEMLGFLKITYHHNIKLEEFFNSSELMHLMRIIQELFNNAIKHSKAKVVNLSLDHNSNFMIISYSDNGVGIPNKIILSPGNFLSLKRRTQILNGDYVIKNSDKGGVEFIFNIPIGS